VRKSKRLFDLLLAVVGLLLLFPLFVLIAIFIKIDGQGPIFFRQKRVGRGGKEFRIFKFRTMVTDAEHKGALLTVTGDPRITRVGRWLRKWKLDELPQLLNVIRGEMSFVGPRPEVPRYVKLYSDLQRRVLELTPGITDPASIAYRSENDLLAAVEDPERYYIEQVMPDKIRINLEYSQRATIWTDLLVILRTMGVLVHGDLQLGNRSSERQKQFLSGP